MFVASFIIMIKISSNNTNDDSFSLLQVSWFKNILKISTSLREFFKYHTTLRWRKKSQQFTKQHYADTIFKSLNDRVLIPSLSSVD